MYVCMYACMFAKSCPQADGQGDTHSQKCAQNVGLTSSL